MISKSLSPLFLTEFAGAGAVLIKINKEIAHSVKNNGDKDLEIVALSNRIFSKKDSDTFYRDLLQ